MDTAFGPTRARIGTVHDRRTVDWLADQQCADGSFEAFRSNTSTPCSPSDPKNFSGPDTNSTAMAAIALFLAGRTAPARDAIVWLNNVQNDDWGFPFYAGAGDVFTAHPTT